jgi:hypothetical protein
LTLLIPSPPLGGEGKGEEVAGDIDPWFLLP